MTRVWKTLLAGGLAVLVAAVGIAYSSRGRDGEVRFRRLEADLAQANAKLGALERRPPVVVVPDPDAPRRSVEKLAVAMDQRLAAEERDAAWSGTTEQALRTAVAERAAGSTLLDVQCRKSVCRLLVRHASPADRKGFAQSVSAAEPFHAATLYRYGSGSPEAALETSVYVVREGYNLQGDVQSTVRAPMGT